MQVTIRKAEAGLIRGVNLDCFTAILETLASPKPTTVLPPDSMRFIVHPGNVALHYWEWLMRGVAFLYFFEARTCKAQSEHADICCHSAFDRVQPQLSTIAAFKAAVITVSMY